MRIKCERQSLTSEQLAVLAPHPSHAPVFGLRFRVEEGEVYDVTGLYIHRGLVWYNVIDAGGKVVSAPSQLFAIVDGGIPASWIVSVDESRTVVFVGSRGSSYLYFADDVDNSVDTAIVELDRILDELGRKREAR
jgi:hypothetical protein